MSTLISPPYSPTSLEIRGYLHQIGHQLLETDTPLLSKRPLPVELQQLEKLNQTLTAHARAHFDRCRALYADVAQADLQSDEGKQRLATLKRDLTAHLQKLDETGVLGGQSLRTFMANDAGLVALELEARLNIQDSLLHREEARLVQNLGLGPSFRPGIYALTFSYRAQTIEFAGAFVLTEKNTPVVAQLTPADDAGYVVLFTPARGFESFSSLAEMNRRLRETIAVGSWRKEFMRLLPRRYWGLSVMGVWPLQLVPINSEPLCEHTYDARLAKRALDIDWALSLDANPDHSARQLLAELDDAIRAALPDLSPRLELRAQRLLDRCLEHSAPAWYRNAPSHQREALARQLSEYDEARQALLNLFGHAASPQALACYQLLEQLAADLEITDLDPDRLQVRTRRSVARVGAYEQKHNLTALALRGLHTGDELPGSAFLLNTTLTYADAPLPERYQDLTPAYLVSLLDSLKPRAEFEAVRREYYAKPQIHAAIEQMLDRRINALAYTATLQNHITEADYQRVTRLRRGTDAQLHASSVALNGCVLKDLWLLRERDEQGAIQRLLLCTPEAPQAQQFHGFDTETGCQAHILGWCADETMRAYLLGQVALKSRAGLETFMAGLGFIPARQEYRHVTFSQAADHADCLKALRAQLLQVQTDDYHWGTPMWYRAATEAQRRQLTQLAENAEGAANTYAQNPLSDARFISFERFLHAQAKTQLNALLGRQRQNDVDPDTVWVHYPKDFPALTRPASVSYTRLYRDGYEDSLGFLDARFDTVATFMGPAGVDLSKLTPRNVALSVRGVWIGQRYADEVQAKLQNPASPGYALRRDATLAINQLQLHSAALESRLKGHIAQVDLDWFERAIKSLDDTSVETRSIYNVHRLMIDGDWVIDTLLFSHGANPVLLYTPQAPDGVFLREARLFNYLLKKVDGMLDYFSARVGVQSRVRVRRFLQTAQAGLPADLNSTDLSLARYDAIERVPPVLDLRHLLHDMKLQRKIDDVAATTVNRTDMIMGLVWSCLEPLIAIATAPFPVLSLSLGLLLALKDGMLALHAYNQGDTDAALQHFVGYLSNSLGAVFTDLRPALKSIGPLLRPMRHLMRPAAPRQAMALIQQLQPPSPALAGMQAVWFEGRPLWAGKTPDALGRYLLFRQDPVSGKLVSTARLVNQNAEGRWVRSGLTGGAPKRPAPSPHALQRYEVPPELAKDYESVLSVEFRNTSSVDELLGEGTRDSLLTYEMAPLQAPYLHAYLQLRGDADTFFAQLNPIVPRADVLAFEASASHRHILESAFKENPGLVVGAVPGSLAAKQLLIDNMHTLYEQGVRRLYIEYLPADLFRGKLDKFNAGGSYWHISEYLKKVEAALGIANDSPHSYRALILAARRQNIAVCGLDASTGYEVDKAFNLKNGALVSPRPNAQRNFYSHTLIEADIGAKPGEGWVALVDSRRLNTHTQTPGLADLQKTLSVRVEDVAPGQPVGIWNDTPGAIVDDPAAKADFKLTLQTAYTAPPAFVTAPGRANAYSEFDIDSRFVPELHEMGKGAHAFDTRYGSLNPKIAAAESAFRKTRERLNTAAQAFFKTPELPPRPTLPDLPANTTPADFIAQSYQHARGLIVCESHVEQSSKALLIDQMKALKQQGVKTLYMEHLFTDLHQADLDTFQRTGVLPPALKDRLWTLDRGHMPEYRGPHTYTSVVEVAGKHGLRIRALDCVSSYHTKGMSAPQTSRIAMFNFFAGEVIRLDQAAQGAHKWVAHMGNAHVHSVEGIAGVAQTQGAISLRLSDVPAGTTSELRSGLQWTVAYGSSLYPNRLTAIRSDFTLAVGIPGMRPPRAYVPADRSRLTRPGQFMVEQLSLHEVNLVHHSRSGEILSTPVQIDDQGRFFIERWAELKDERFSAFERLLSALDQVVKLTHVQ